MLKNYLVRILALSFMLFLFVFSAYASVNSFSLSTSVYPNSLLNIDDEVTKTSPYLPFLVNETTEVQIIHNSPDPSLNTVDVYVNGDIFLDDVEFRTATAFISVPANEDLDIAIAPSTSQNASEAFFTTTVNLLDTEQYIIVANGVQITANFDASVNSDIQFSLDVFQGARETSIGFATTDILFHHGVTDLPNIDIDEITLPAPNLFTDLAFTDFNNYIQIGTNDYTLQPIINSTQTELQAYDLPLDELNIQSQAITLLASGFVNSANNQNGPEFGLWLALPSGGQLIELPFQGECVTSQTPFLEDFSGEDWVPGVQFENGGDSINECWTRNPENLSNVYAWGTGDNSSQIFNSGPNEAFQGSNFIYTKPFGNAGDEAQFISPVINTSNLNTPALSFYYFMFGTDVGSLDVEIKEFGTENWINIFSETGQQQTSSADDWLEEEVELTSYQNTKVQLRFTATRGQNFANAIAIDLIEVREATTCLEPSNFSVSQVGETTVQLNWNQQTNPVNWLIFQAGANPETATPVVQSSTSVTGNNAQVTNLVANTTYDAYLQSNCGADGLSDLEGPVEFTTAACAVSEQCEFTFNLLDEFGDGWNGNIVELRQDGQLVANLGENFQTGSSFTETYSLCTGSFIELIWLNTGGFPEEVGLNVVDPFNDQIFELEFDSANQRGTTIDSFTSTCTPPTCPEVENVQVVNISDNGADITWNNEPEADLGYTWFVFNEGANPTTDTPVDTGTVNQGVNNVSVNGLASSESYDAYIIANCGANDDSLFSDGVTFNTSCSTIDAPILEDFSDSQWVSGTGFNNDGDQISDCWTRETDGHLWGTRTGATQLASSGPNSAFLGQNYIYAVGVTGNNGDTATITSPQIDLSNLTNPGITFFYFMRGNNIGELALEVKALSSSNWVELESIVGAQQTDVNDDWEEVIISLNAFAGEIIEYRFVATKGSGFSADIAVDAVEVGEVNPCLRPKDLEINNIDIDNAELSWSPADATATSFIWEVYLEGENPETTSPVAEGTAPGNTSTAILTGLEADTSYDAYVIAVCSDSEVSNRSIPTSFRTLICNASDTCAYTFELFDSFGDGWNGNTMTVFQNGEEVAVLGQSFTSGNSDTEIVNLCNDTSIELFWNAGGQFTTEVGITILNPFDEEIYQKNPGEGSQNTTLTTFTSDCDAPDGCFAPINFDIVEVTPESVELSWDNIGSAISGYNWFIFNAADNPQATNPVVNGSTGFEVNTVLVNGLDENTAYKAYIRSDCGFTGVSPISDPLFFNTPCNPIEAPYLVDFESNDWSSQISGNESIGDCWSRDPEFQLGTYSWFTFSQSNVNNPIGDNFLVASSQLGSNGDEAIIELPAIDLSNLDEPSFNYFYLFIGNNPGTVEVEIKESTSTSWTNLKTYSEAVQNNSTDEFAREVFDLIDYANQIVNIRFVSTRTSDNTTSFIIDDLRVDELPVCVAPLNPVVTNIQTDSAFLSFQADESALDGYTWFAYLTGEDPETATPVASGDTNSINNILISGLSPATTYDVYVQSNCFNNEESELSDVVTFSTEVCEDDQKCSFTFTLEDSAGNGWNGATMQVVQNGVVVATLGENFSNGSIFEESVALCDAVNTDLIWNIGGSAASEVSVTITNPFNEEIYNSAETSINPSETIFNFTSSCTPPVCELPINVEVTNVLQTEATLNWEEVENTNPQLNFNWFVYLDGNTPGVDSPVSSGNVSSPTNTVNLSGLEIGTTYQVYLQAECEFSDSELTDAITFTTFGECNAPENIVVDEVLINEATLSWDDFANALNGYNWEVYLSNEDPETATPSFSGTLAAGITSINLTGLSELTDYDFYIQSDCDVAESEFSIAISFSTIGECDSPNAINFDEVTQTTASFSWSAVANASLGYTYVVHNEGEGPDVNTAIFSESLSETNTQITDLLPSTNYDVYIQSDCDFEISEFQGPFSFTTLNPECNAPTNLNISNIGLNEINLNWDGVESAQNGYIWYIFDEFATISVDTALESGTVEFGTNSLIIEGLIENTTYQVSIVSDCGVNQSDFSQVITFTTEDSGCETPDNLIVTSISGTSVSLGWDDVANSVDFNFGGYTWFVYNDQDIPGVATPVNTNTTDSNFVDVDNLQASTTYQAYVLANCDTGDSNLSAPVTFTTTNVDESCLPVQNIQVSNITQTSIFLSWDASQSSAIVAYEWIIRETSLGTPIVSSGTVDSVITNVSVDNLTPNTTYTANIITDCGLGTPIAGQSFTFTTLDTLASPDNDDLCNAIAVPEFTTIIGDNTNATTQANEPIASCFTSGINNTIWFTYVAPSSSNTDIIVQSLSNLGTAQIAVYETIDDCADLTSLVEVACGVGTGTNGESIISPTGLTQGDTYYIQVSFAAGDEGTFEIFIDSNFSNNDFNAIEISMFPNPASNILNIEAPQQIEYLTIYNMLGQTLYSKSQNQSTTVIPVQNLESGQYFVKVKIDGKNYIKAFIKD